MEQIQAIHSVLLVPRSQARNAMHFYIGAFKAGYLGLTTHWQAVSQDQVLITNVYLRIQNQVFVVTESAEPFEIPNFSKLGFQLFCNDPDEFATRAQLHGAERVHDDHAGSHRFIRVDDVYGFSWLIGSMDLIPDFAVIP